MKKTFLITAIASVESLNDEHNYNKAYFLVGEDRRCKACKYKSFEDKKRCVGAGILLGHLLKIARAIDKNGDLKEAQGLLNVDLTKAMASYDISYNYKVIAHDNEKPYFADYPELYFNISHSGKFVVCTLSDADVGVDIEGGRDADLRVAERFFKDSEVKMIKEALSDEEKNNLLFKFWTMKEACVKLTGIGIARGLKEIQYPELNENRMFNYKFEDYYITVVTE